MARDNSYASDYMNWVHPILLCFAEVELCYIFWCFLCTLACKSWNFTKMQFMEADIEILIVGAC